MRTFTFFVWQSLVQSITLNLLLTSASTLHGVFVFGLQEYFDSTRLIRKKMYQSLKGGGVKFLQMSFPDYGLCAKWGKMI